MIHTILKDFISLYQRVKKKYNNDDLLLKRKDSFWIKMREKESIGKSTGNNTNFCADTLVVVNRGKWQMFFELMLNYIVILKMLFWLTTTSKSNGKCLLYMHKFDKAGGLSISVDCAQAPTQMRVYTKSSVWEPVWWSHLTWFRAQINLFIPSWNVYDFLFCISGEQNEMAERRMFISKYHE